jgi:diguanylate cyclase (GGDEF)-like protein/PAS domain S-box-containing protein
VGNLIAAPDPSSVLLLEHDPGDAGRVLSALAEAQGRFRAEWVNRLHEAAAVLVEQDVDCLIVGLGLPDARGFEVVEVLRDAALDAAVIVLTDRSDSQLAFRALQAGVDDYLLRDELPSRDLSLSVQYAIERATMKKDLKRAESAARALSAIVESTADAILTKNVHGVIRTWNRGAEQLYGYPAADVIGRHVDLLHPWDQNESIRILSSAGEGETVRGMETVHRTSFGSLIDVSLTVSPLVGEHGQHLGASVIARDISERRQLEERLRRQALFDGLTGLPNRRLLEDRLHQALADAARSGRPVAVLFLDLDRFKEVNDNHGHLAGDRLLVEFARRIRSVVRPADTVARLGGDEFVVVCQDADLRAAKRVAMRITGVLAKPMEIGGRDLTVTASIGAVSSPPCEPDIEALLLRADTAMYRAKARRRSRAQTDDPVFPRQSRP